ncbi:MAG: hypothetical protein JSV04_14625, partial [Candidatus Heimdallarchaeota archaeon]
MTFEKEKNVLTLVIILLLSQITILLSQNSANNSNLLQNNFSSESMVEVQIIDEILYLESERIRLGLNLASKGSIHSIVNKQTHQHFHFANQSTRYFWSIFLLSYDWYSAESSTSFAYSTTINSAVLNYSISLGEGLMNVSVFFQVNDPHPGINCRMSIECLNTFPGIYKVFLPYLNDLMGWALSGQEEIALADREGWLMTEAMQTLQTSYFGAEYPGTLSMQFLVLSEPDVGGFVISARDPESNSKGIELYSDTNAVITWYHYSDNLRYQQGSNFSMDYWMVIDAYQGRTWAAGADQYKEWALKQWYVDKGPINLREDIPEWLKSIDYIWKGSSYSTDHSTGVIIKEGDSVDKMGQYPVRFSENGLSENLLIDWWAWSSEGHDRAYPEYFPARDGNDKLTIGINEAHNNSARVMLYFNGRLVDTATATYANNQQHLTAYEDNIYIEQYHPYFSAAVADPASDWWQETVANFSERAVEEFNVDVVYLDQISVASPKFDYRDVLTHPPGGGSWWQKAENDLLSKVRKRIRNHNPEACIGSENILETYLNNVDLFWNYHTSYGLGHWYPNGHTIPLFSYVYHKYALSNGRGDIWPGNEEIFIWAVSEELQYGYIPGGTGDIATLYYMDQSAFNIIKKAYSTRRIGDFQFFRDGDLYAPVEWENSPTLTLSDWGNSIIVPQGTIQAYQGEHDIAILFSNRGSSHLIWNGNISELLLNSGVSEQQIKNIESFDVLENGEIVDIRDFTDKEHSIEV